MMGVPSKDAMPASRAIGGGGGGDTSKGNDDFVSTAHSVDRECRRLGYQTIVRQRRSGTEFVCVPALLHNCSALLALVAAGSRGPRSRAHQSREKRRSTIKRPQVNVSRDSSCAVAAVGSSIIGGNANVNASATNSAAVLVKDQRSGWKRLFSRRTSSKAVALEIPTDPMSIPEAVDICKTAEEAPQVNKKKVDTIACMQKLLQDVRHSVERLVALGGLVVESDAVTLASPPPPLLTGLQREVLYFQTIWPRIHDALVNKLTEIGRVAKRLEDGAAAKAKAEAGAKARSFAKMANMEAELRRLRTELRRSGRPVKPQTPLAGPPQPHQSSQSAVQKPGLATPQSKQQQRRLPLKRSEASSITATAVAAPAAGEGDIGTSELEVTELNPR